MQAVHHEHIIRSKFKASHLTAEQQIKSCRRITSSLHVYSTWHRDVLIAIFDGGGHIAHDIFGINLIVGHLLNIRQLADSQRCGVIRHGHRCLGTFIHCLFTPQDASTNAVDRLLLYL